MVKQSYRNLTVNDDGRINRAKYELALLHNLKDKLKIKKVCIKNSYKYRNPEEDLPQDFRKQRKHYYKFVNSLLMLRNLS